MTAKLKKVQGAWGDTDSDYLGGSLPRKNWIKSPKKRFPKKVFKKVQKLY
tara:strand:- start:219 stop:368 length:150 start_codon:yes stop_codon:yes gene_type:complete